MKKDNSVFTVLFWTIAAIVLYGLCVWTLAV